MFFDLPALSDCGFPHPVHLRFPALPVLYGFFGTAFDWRSIILSLVNLALAVIIYFPFVKLANNPKFENAGNAGNGEE